MLWTVKRRKIKSVEISPDFFSHNVFVLFCFFFACPNAHSIGLFEKVRSANSIKDVLLKRRTCTIWKIYDSFFWLHIWLYDYFESQERNKAQKETRKWSVCPNEVHRNRSTDKKNTMFRAEKNLLGIFSLEISLHTLWFVEWILILSYSFYSLKKTNMTWCTLYNHVLNIWDRWTSWHNDCVLHGKPINWKFSFVF